ncbi:MAG: MerR family transcriptional regulator, partial [bacterium]|nr:MerR family transcriptional regulator [bacterium]
ALAEIRRVLKPAGRFFAATNGATGMRELFELVKRVNPDAYDGSSSVNAFGLENGADQLAPWFEGVEVRRHENALAVTEADPLIAYVASSDRLNEDQLIALRNIVEAELQEEGVIHIRKDQGLFAARKATR